MELYPRRILTVLSVGLLVILLNGCVPLSPTFEPPATLDTITQAVIPTAMAEEASAAVLPAAEEADAAPTALAPTDQAKSDAASTDVAPTAPAPTDQVKSDAASTDVAPRAEVLVPMLNMRGGPGTNYPILSTTKKGQQFEVVGQVNACRWLLVRTDDGEAWISGGAQFTRLNIACSAVAAAIAPPIPTPLPTATSVPSATSVPTATPMSEEPAAAQPTAPAVTEPAPPPTSPATAEDPLPADQGCYLFQNQLGPEITITLTRRGGDWTDTFKLQPNEERPYCLSVGFYDYTLDAPPPYGALNDTIEVKAGDRFYFPIRPKD